MTNRTHRTPPLAVLDIAAYALSVLPGAIAWSSAISGGVKAYESGYFLPYAPIAPLILSFVFIGITWIMRLALPRLHPGAYRIGFNGGTLAWYCHLALNRSLKVSGLRYLVNSLYLTKFLVHRALGAKIAWNVSTPMESTFVDLPLIEIGSGTFFGENAHIVCHFLRGDLLWLRRVKIGKNVFIGMNCTIGPGTQIGDDAWIGFGNILTGEHIEKSGRLEDGQWRHGSPKRSRARDLYQAEKVEEQKHAYLAE